jgi:hypothetical protein
MQKNFSYVFRQSMGVVIRVLHSDDSSAFEIVSRMKPQSQTGTSLLLITAYMKVEEIFPLLF